MPSDSAAGDAASTAVDVAKEQALKQAKKAALKAIWAVIAPALPFILLGLAILFIIGIIALVIIGYVNKGSTGVTGLVPSTAITENLTLAKTNDAGAKTQAVSLAGGDLMTTLDVLKGKLTATGDKTNLQKLNDLETALLSLTTNDPTNTVSISEIQRRINELKSATGANYPNDFVNIQAALDKLNKVILTTTSPQLVISGKDLYYIRTHQVDERVLEALNYLVTPVAQGGAGFRKIKVRRIKADYDTSNKQFSQEWEFTSDSDRSISPHFSGQAVDIAGIDMVERSLYKKGIVRKKREAQAPVDIMVSYQSTVPGKSLPGSSVTSTGFSFGNLSSNQALVDLFNVIGQNSGIDFSKYNLEGATLPEIAKTMGLVALDQGLSLAIDPKDDNSSQAKFLENIGREYIAKQFSLPKEGLKGGSHDEMQNNIGREVLAQRMKLAPLSLTGGTSGQLFDSVGKRKIEKSFGLRAGSLDYLPMGGDFTAFVGQIIIEEKLNLEGGTFDGGDLNQIRNKINMKGDSRFENVPTPDNPNINVASLFDTMFSQNSDEVDTLLSLPPDTNHTNSSYTANFVAGLVSVDDYKHAVGQSLIDTVSTNFKAQPALDTLSSGKLGVNVGGTFLSSSGVLYNQEDAAWDMPDGSIAKVIGDNYSAFYDIGVDEVAKRLVDDAGERQVLKLWFTTYKNRSLGDIRFIYSELLDRIQIRFKDELLPNNDVAVEAARKAANEALANASNVPASEEQFPPFPAVSSHQNNDNVIEDINGKQTTIRAAIIAQGCVPYDWGCANGKAVVANYNRQLGALEELKWQIMLGDEEEWFDIDSDAIDSTLGLPQNGITKIFQLDQGDEVFYAVGGAKIETSDNLYNPNALADSNSRITFYSQQIYDTTSKILDLQTARAQEQDPAKQKDLDNQIAMYQRSLTTWNNQSRLEQNNNSEIQAALNNTKPVTKDTAIKFNFTKFSDINYDISAVSKSLGAQKIESALNLPAGSLSSVFDYTLTESPELKYLESQREGTNKTLLDLQTRKNKGEKGLDTQIVAQKGVLKVWDDLIAKQKKADSSKPQTKALQTDPTIIGRRQIEEILSIPSGSFGGNTIDDLTNRLGGAQKLYGYFAPGVSFDKINAQLPITDQNAYGFKSILKATDDKLNLSTDDTYDLLKGNTTPNQYAKEVGLATIRTRAVNTFGDRLGLNIGGYTLTGNDVTSMLNGDYLAVLLKVGAKNIDDNINLPIGTVKAMIDDPSINCQVKDPTTRLQQSCLENLLVANGQEKIARYLGVYGTTTTSNNISEKIGQAAIEKGLDELYPNPKISSGWFNGANLIDISRNLAINNLNSGDPNLVLLNKKDPTPADTILINGIINQYGKDVLAKFGFVGSNFSVYNANQLNFTPDTNPSSPYSLAKKVDDKLDLTTGTTAQFFQGKITATEYKNNAQKTYIDNKAASWIYDALPPEVQKYIKEPLISGFLNSIDLFNLGKHNPAEVKAYGNIAQQGESKKARLSNIINNDLSYIGKYPTENLLGQYAIEDELSQSTDPYGWFNEFETGTISKVTGLPGVANNIVFLKYVVPDLKLNPSSASIWNAVNDPNRKLEAEQMLLSRFGFTGFQSLAALKSDAFDPNNASPTNPYVIARKTDDRLSLEYGSTQALFQGTMSVEDYKERAQKAYIKYSVGEVIYDDLLPPSIQQKLAKHGITGDVIKNALNDPDDLYNAAIFSIIKPDDMYAIMGFSDILGFNIPIKGDFPDNFAQRVVEERLGLIAGSFSPNSTIENVMNVNTPKKFAASFRITANYSQTDSQMSVFLTNNVFKEGTDYWDASTHAGNISRSNNIDGVLKLSKDETVSNPTEELLQEKISISQYLSLIRKNQFSQFDNETFLNDFISFLTTSDQSSSKYTKTAAYVGLAVTAFAIFKDPKLAGNQSIQLNLLHTLKSAGIIDLDDHMGFSPGTMETLITHPGDARSILFAQGLRSLAANNFLGDAEPYKNDLLILFQYLLPSSISNPAYFVSLGQGEGGAGLDPNNGNNCVLPDQTMDYRVSMLPGDQQNFRKRHATLCAYQIVDVALHDVIKQATTIKDKNGNMLPGGEGIDVPLTDIGLLARGDMGVLTNIGLAYAVNRVRAEQDSDGNNLQLIPPDFHIGYSDMKSAINPSSSEKNHLKNVAVANYDDSYATANGGTLPQCYTPASSSSEATNYTPAEPTFEPTFEETQCAQFQAGEAQARNSAVVNAKKDIEYRYMDAQLMSIARANDAAPIPPGFTKTMFTGTDEERENMLLAYAISNLLLGKNFDKLFGDMAKEITVPLKAALNKFVYDKNKGELRDYFIKGGFVMQPIYNYCDEFLTEKLNALGIGHINLPTSGGIGMSEYILLEGYNALGGNISQEELTKLNNFGKNIATNFAISLASTLADKKLGLKPGTTQAMYNIYKAYRAVETAQKTYNGVKAGTEAAKTAGNALKAAKVDLINLGVQLALYVFSNELLVTDQKLNLPPGSTASIISLAAAWAISAVFATNPVTIYIAAAIMIYTVLFGFSKVEYQITCAGDYTFKSWCTENDALYKQWAQLNVRKLINDMLLINERTKQNNLLPTIMGTFRKEDYNYFYGISPDGTEDLISKYYGGPSLARGVKGLYQSDYMEEFVHIGY